MNSTEAKFILSAYRPDGQDAGDPCFAEALALTQRDPLLQDWLRDQMAFDRAFSAALQAVAVPRELRSSILAGGGMSRRPRAFFPPRWLMAAAAMILLALGAWWMLRPAPPIDGRYAALKFVTSAKPADFDRAGPGFTEVQNWLRDRGTLLADLPAGLQAGLPAIGCKVIQWNGHPISIVCFRRSDGRLFHLAVADSVAMPEATEQPRFARLGEWATVSWRRGGKACFLATLGSEEELRTML